MEHGSGDCFLVLRGGRRSKRAENAAPFSRGHTTNYTALQSNIPFMTYGTNHSTSYLHVVTLYCTRLRYRYSRARVLPYCDLRTNTDFTAR